MKCCLVHGDSLHLVFNSVQLFQFEANARTFFHDITFCSYFGTIFTVPSTAVRIFAMNNFVCAVYALCFANFMNGQLVSKFVVILGLIQKIRLFKYKLYENNAL